MDAFAVPGGGAAYNPALMHRLSPIPLAAPAAIAAGLRAPVVRIATDMPRQLCQPAAHSSARRSPSLPL